MISEKSFSKEWIAELRSQTNYKKSHPELMEKMIYALYLVEMLVNEKLDFMFKGGTCLTLLIPEVRRFSIDVDITTEVDKEDLEETLNKIIKVSRFARFELDSKRSFKDGFPKAHYNLFYASEYDGTENSILLDVVFDKSPYSEIIEVAVENDFLLSDSSNIMVKVPSINSITGDKLTAFAPNTIGVPYQKGKELQIIKQLYDVSRLCELTDSLETVRNTFEKVCDAQFSYLGKEFSYDDVLNDTIYTAFLLGMRNRNKGEAKDKFDELMIGIKSFPPYLPTPQYTEFNAIEDTSKAALLAAKLLVKNYDPFPIISKVDYNPKEYQIIGDQFSPLYKMIKGMPNLSLLYWDSISKLLN
ncbi:MAG: nucleotidyl transferase AbiEii/AbiGii toxin family protein [Ignavibacteriales bacterium]|nr:nucleotidyl transferase AbiEii/AbiGii toxin family protein [Ignavibacteriales bacterium]